MNKLIKPSFLLFLLILCFQLQSQNIEYIRIKNLDKKLIIEAEVNGKKGYFLIDTGSDISVINASRLKKFRLEDKKIYGNASTAMAVNGGLAEVKKVAGINVKFTENVLHDDFFSLDIDDLTNSIYAKTNYQIDGIIGADFLIKYRVTIDYHNRHISMTTKESKKVPSPIVFEVAQTSNK